MSTEAQAMLIEVPARDGNPDTDQRFTLEGTLAWCLKVAGLACFTLDVAACFDSKHAPSWYSKAQNGLVLPWFGNVFCNPPWSDIGPWVARAWAVWRLEATLERAAHHLPPITSVSMLLPCRQHMPWWQEHVEPFRDGRGAPAGAEGVQLTTHYPSPRPTYGHPGNPRGVGCVEPNFGSVLFVWRR